MNEFGAFIVIVILCIACFGLGITIMGDVKDSMYDDLLPKAAKEIIKCEAELPRHLQCKIEWKVVANESIQN